jgi:hypothetical protein
MGAELMIELKKLRISPRVVVVGLVLGLSACTNPYDPVQRTIGGGLIGAGSGAVIGAAAAGGHGAAFGAEERWVRWEASSPRRDTGTKLEEIRAPPCRTTFK